MPLAAEPPVVAPVITQVMAVTPQLSLVDGFMGLNFLLQFLPFTLSVMLAGHVMTGAWLSTTVTLIEQVLVAEPLVAVQVIVVTPLFNGTPDSVVVPDPVVAPLNV